MLENKQLKAFAPTVMPGKAKSFYRDILGLKLLSEDNFGLEFDANGTVLRIAIVRQFTPQPFTVLGWNVDDISSTVNSLKQLGVQCERYDSLNQDNSGIWISPEGSKVAWFKDYDGNLLSLTQ